MTREGILNAQFIFRKGWITINSALQATRVFHDNSNKLRALITLDVQNSFNTTAWSLIINKLS